MKRLTDTKTHLRKIKACFFDCLHEREKGVLGRQRVAVFIYSSLFLVIGAVLNVCEIIGPQPLFFRVANSVHGLITIATFALYYYRKISLINAISVFCVVSQVEISVENIHCALLSTPYSISLIIGNMVLSAILLLLSVIAYLRITPYVVAALAMSVYGACTYLTGSEIMANFFFVLLFAFFVLSILSATLTANVSRLERENTTLKDEQQEVLDAFRLNKEQMQSYMILAHRKKLKAETTAELLDTMGSEAKRHIRDNVATYIKQTSVEVERLSERLPELSASELEICVLILKEMKLKEVSEELGKSPSNITCQRTNIRTKLGLRKEENLFRFLKKRMENPE